MSAELREVDKAAILTVWKGANDCPICLANDWTVANRIEADVNRPARLCLVLVPVVCQKCGYALFFHEGLLHASS